MRARSWRHRDDIIRWSGRLCLVSFFNRRLMVGSGAVGVIGLGLLVVIGLADAPTFFRAYLLGYTFWLGLGLGSLGVVLVQFLTGGNWGLATRRVLEAGSATLPLMAILFIPLLFGLPNLYAWARPQDVAADAILQHKAIYLNVPFSSSARWCIRLHGWGSGISYAAVRSVKIARRTHSSSGDFSARASLAHWFSVLLCRSRQSTGSCHWMRTGTPPCIPPWWR
jgi:hypothetical protein